MINVTKTFLPPFDEYTAYLKRAWDNAWITNNGELVRELEQKLKEYLGVSGLFFTNNGTVVLQMALKVLKRKGEIITTPFSYVATTNAILWEGFKPVFVDINDRDFCIDASKIEAAITHDTVAILATHVYGNPCDVEKIEEVAKRYNLTVIYDGAHAFGATYKGKQILSFGDISTCSFHATKVFHTVEGGCIIARDAEMANQLYLIRQFGHIYDEYFTVGINAKNSEFHAAMGLANYAYLDQIICKRKEASGWYDTLLEGSDLQRPVALEGTMYNYAYYPVVFSSEQLLLTTIDKLKEKGVLARRYFYPSLNKLPFLQNTQPCRVSESIALRALSLPLSTEITLEEVTMIVATIKEVLK